MDKQDVFCTGYMGVSLLQAFVQAAHGFAGVDRVENDPFVSGKGTDKGKVFFRVFSIAGTGPAVNQTDLFGGQVSFCGR